MSAETTWSSDTDPDSALYWAYRYAHKGWAVLPVWSAINGCCQCGHPHDGTNGLPSSSIGKHPVRGLSWTDASTDLAQIETWFTDTGHNIAIVPALSGLSAVDVDGPAGEAELVALEAEHGTLPPTLTDRSGRQDGGRHLFFATDNAPPSKSLHDHIDTRGAAGYVIVAPSMHQSGRRYEWQNWPTAPAPLPAWIDEKLQPQATPTVDADAEPLPDPVPAWLTRWFTEEPVDGTRYRRHYALVARCVEMGLSNGQIVTAVAKHPPSVDKFGRRLKAETLRVLGKVAHLRKHHDAEHDGPDVEDRLLTDVGNADRLVDEHGHRFRYVGAWGTWLHWDGSRWSRDRAGMVVEAAKATTRTMMRDAAELSDSNQRKQATAWALKSESAQRIDAMIRLARSAPGIPVEPDLLDSDPWMLNVRNGTINLHTGLLLEHNPARLCTKLAPVDYNPEARAPQWDKFLRTVLPDDEVREFMARWFGYCLTGDVSEQKVVIEHGIGANGKSTANETLRHVLGDYAIQAAPDLLIRSRNDPHPTGQAALHGARLVLAAETGQNRKLDENLLKRLTGGDTISARKMHQDFFEFQPTHKIVVATNHRPGVDGTDHGIWRRIRLVPFSVIIAHEDQDEHLAETLRSESAGILRWAVDACLRWQKDGLTEPFAVTAATADYRADMDILGDFLSENCIMVAGFSTRASDLYAAYQRWAETMGETPVSQRKLGLALRERGLHKTTSGVVWWDGISLTSTQADVA